MKQDKFLLGILIFIGVLVIAALVLFFIRSEAPVYQAEDTPAGIVHNYIAALQQKDFSRAYSYLAEGENKPGIQAFRQRFTQYYDDSSNYVVDIGETRITGETAEVMVSITYVSNNPFQMRGSGEVSAAILTLQGGTWKITSMPYPFWDWAWYQEQPK